MTTLNPLNLDLASHCLDSPRHEVLRKRRDRIIVLTQQVGRRDILPRRSGRLRVLGRNGVRFDERKVFLLL